MPDERTPEDEALELRENALAEARQLVKEIRTDLWEGRDVRDVSVTFDAIASCLVAAGDAPGSAAEAPSLGDVLRRLNATAHGEKLQLAIAAADELNGLGRHVHYGDELDEEALEEAGKAASSVLEFLGAFLGP